MVFFHAGILVKDKWKQLIFHDMGLIYIVSQGNHLNQRKIVLIFHNIEYCLNPGMIIE